MYTFPGPSRKFVYANELRMDHPVKLIPTFSVTYVKAAAWSRWKLQVVYNELLYPEVAEQDSFTEL